MRNQRNIFRTFILVYFSFPAVLFAQAGKLSLQQAIETGLKNNYSILVAKNEAEIAKNNNSPGNAGFLPALSINAATNNASNTTNQEYSSGQTLDKKGVKSSTFNSNALFSWTLFDGMKMFAARDRLSLLDSSGGLNYKYQLESTISSIIIAYYDVIRQSEGLANTKEMLKLSEERLKITEKRFELGSGSRLEMLQAKVDRNSAKSAVLKQDLILKTTKTTLNQLIARPPEVDFEPSDSIIISYQPKLDDLKRTSNLRNLVINQYQLNKDLSLIAIKEIGSAMYPKVAFNSSYVFSRSDNQAGLLLTSQTLGWNYGFSISMPLFNGLNIKNQIQNAKLAALGADLKLSDAKLKLNSELIRSWQEYQQNLEILSMEKENIEVARENLFLAEERFKLGTINSLDLKQAENSYLEASLRLMNARFTAKSSETNLMRINGDLIK